MPALSFLIRANQAISLRRRARKRVMLSVKSALLIYRKPDLMLKIHRLERRDGPSAFRGKSGFALSYRWSQRSHTGASLSIGTYRQHERWRVAVLLIRCVAQRSKAQTSAHSSALNTRSVVRVYPNNRVLSSRLATFPAVGMDSSRQVASALSAVPWWHRRGRSRIRARGTFDNPSSRSLW
jgi:hypothetical protein